MQEGSCADITILSLRLVSVVKGETDCQCGGNGSMLFSWDSGGARGPDPMPNVVERTHLCRSLCRILVPHRSRRRYSCEGPQKISALSEADVLDPLARH